MMSKKPFSWQQPFVLALLGLATVVTWVSLEWLARVVGLTDFMLVLQFAGVAGFLTLAEWIIGKVFPAL